MTEYNKITCEYCGGDHFQRDCPDLREERSLASAPGYASNVWICKCGNVEPQGSDDCRKCGKELGHGAKKYISLEYIVEALKAAEMFIAIHHPTPYSETCVCGSCKVTRILRHNADIRRGASNQK